MFFFLLVAHSTGHFDQMLTGHAANQCVCSGLVAHSTGHFDQMLTACAVSHVCVWHPVGQLAV